jgi:hypothetical protein
VSLNFCCTTPLPPSGIGNIGGEPLFVNRTGGDFHLQTNSPCIEAGNNSYVVVTNDPDGNPRIVGNNVDIGAYEFQAPTFIAAQPQSQTAYGNQSAIFTVTAVSPLPLSYQWWFNGSRIDGATDSTLTLSNVQLTNSGNYRVVISNAFVSVTSSNAALTVVFPPPTLITQPTNQSAILGSNAVFTVVAFSPYPMNFRWQLNGTNLTEGGRITGATNTLLMISPVSAGDAGSYQVVVTNNYGAVTSAVATLTVLGAPIVLMQPSNLVSMPCSSTNLSVTALGAPPLFYQWRKDGVPLTDGSDFSGSASATLTITSAQTPDTGQYSVIVSNWFGTVSSTNAILIVVPVALWGNVPIPVPREATNLLAIAAGHDYGSPGFNLALRSDGTVIAWGDNSSMTNSPPDLTNVVAISAGHYHALALRQDGTVTAWGDNSYGEATPPPDATNVVAIAAGVWHSLALRNDGTLIAWGDNSQGEIIQPVNATNVIAIAAGPDLSLALRQDGTVVGWGVNMYGMATPPINATNMVATSGGDFHSLGLRSDGSIVGWGYNGNGEISPPAEATNLIAIAVGNGLSLALRQDGKVIGWGYNIAGETTPPANLTNVVAISAKDYHGMALVQDPTTHVPPRIVQQPSDSAPLVGQTTILISQTIGSLPFQFQWYFHDEPILSGTNRWLALTSLRPEQAGEYHVVINNNFGAVTSRVAVVTESPYVAIAAQPKDQSAIVSSNAAFTVGMYGLPPFSYQWYFNGAPLSDDSHISGSTAASLTISNVQISDGGGYSVIVSNAFNTSTSIVASLTVLVPAGILSQPTNQSVLLNSNAAFTVTATGTGTPSYQWQFNGVNLNDGGRVSGSGGPTLTVFGVQTNDGGAYQVIVANNYGAITSSVATLAVYVPVQITGQPPSKAVILTSNATFTVTGTGTALGYQWCFNGTPLVDGGRISGSTSSTLTISNVQVGDAGGYTAIVSNLLSSAASVTASLTPLASATTSVRFVDLNSTTPAPPYLSWATAATNIHDAIDAAVDGDQILVADGIYQVGGRVSYGTLTNRVLVNKAVTVASLNGPAVAMIRGNSGLGNSAIRCVYLTNNAVLNGFTLFNGATRTNGDVFKEQSGGGAWCESTNCLLINCVIVSNAVGQYGGGVFSGTSSNCTIVRNSATNGGGAFGGILKNCTLSTNSAINGGGACSNTLYDCVLTANKTTSLGAGAYNSVLSNCTIAWNTNVSLGGGLHTCVAIGCIISNNFSGGSSGGAYNCSLTNCVILNNLAPHGGGVYSCVLTNCIVTANQASDSLGGAGAYQSTLYYSIISGNRAPTGAGAGGTGCTFNNCIISSNSSSGTGVGAYNSTLNNCTVTGHTNGSATYGCTLRNCIVYYNAANYFSGSFSSCCTTPLASGSGNFTNAPLFVNLSGGDFHLLSISPCINAGRNSFVTNSTDLDGNPRIIGGTVDVGAYEFPTPSSILSYAWAQQFGLPTDGSADYTDTDGDGMNNYSEWIAGTTPTNAASVLALSSPSINSPGLKVSWQSVITRTYFLQRSTNLLAQPAFSSIKSNIFGQAGTTIYSDTTATNTGPYFYRVGVQ